MLFRSRGSLWKRCGWTRRSLRGRIWRSSSRTSRRWTIFRVRNLCFLPSSIFAADINLQTRSRRDSARSRGRSKSSSTPPSTASEPCGVRRRRRRRVGRSRPTERLSRLPSLNPPSPSLHLYPFPWFLSIVTLSPCPVLSIYSTRSHPPLACSRSPSSNINSCLFCRTLRLIFERERDRKSVV